MNASTRIAPVLALFALSVGCYVPVANGALGASEPGRVHVVPGALAIGVGATAILRAELRAPDGTRALEQPALTYASSDERIARIGGDGTVYGVSEGEVSIEVTDGRHGTAIVPVFVGAFVPFGATSLTCASPVVFVPAGTSIRDVVTITDSAGTVLATTDASLAVDDPTVAAVDADGTVRGLADGRTVLRGSGPSGELLGACTIIVSSAASGGGGGGPTVRCDPTFRCAHCEVSRYPRVFGEAGRTQPLRIDTQVFGVREDCTTYLETTYETTPDEVRIEGDGVIAYFGGRMQALAPGVARSTVLWDGIECGTFETRVAVDIRGSWAMSCENGDTGSVTLAGSFWPDLTGRGGFSPRGGPFGVSTRFATGSATICSPDASPPLCEGDASGTATRIERLSGGVGPCSDGGCSGPTIAHCGAQGSGSVIVEGHDRLRVGECTYQRGGGDLSQCGPPDVPGMCQYAGGWAGCPYRSLACIGDGLSACWYEVEGVRFTCSSCPMSPGDPCAQQASDRLDRLCFD